MSRGTPADPSNVERLPLTDARIHLGAVVKRVRLRKTYVILEKNGIPIAGLMDIDEFEDYLELRNPKIRAHIERSRADYVSGRSRPARELLAELRAGRRRLRKRASARSARA